MTRFVFVPLLALTCASHTHAQDMPLSQVLINVEGWKRVEKPGAEPKPVEPNLHMTLSADRGTAFLSSPGQRFLWAAPADTEGVNVTRGAPYAPLRTRRGENSIEVTGLATDKDGRIYAATAIGVQVFDPTGRLCGVMAAPPGESKAMAFEGDKLTLWIGNQKYSRKLNTQGAK